MRREEFHYELPPHLIAQQPLADRGRSRMLVMAPDGTLVDDHIVGFGNHLRPEDLLVFNDTRVIPARLLGQKATGGRIEVLVERIVAGDEMLVQVRASKSPKPATRIQIDGGGELEVLGRDEDFFRVRVVGGGASELLESVGHMPLPPYVQRPDTAEDRARYQTVFAREPGAVAAPTAGLHFDEAQLVRLRESGITTEFLTLHVGAGTFQPIRVHDLSQHRMHSERYSVSLPLCDAVARTRERGGRVVAVGTTVVRALEAAAADGGLAPGEGETRLFITPGFKFRIVDALLTNFHLPESTLLMLVCAFAGQDRVMAAYAHAVRQRYRFFSYGDAMFVPKLIDG